MIGEPLQGAVGAAQRDGQRSIDQTGQQAPVAEGVQRDAADRGLGGGPVALGKQQELVGEVHTPDTRGILTPLSRHRYRQADKASAVYSHIMTSPLADRIRQRLAEMNLSAYAASIKASDGASKDMIKNILSGRSLHPRADTLEKLAQTLETNVDWLLNGDGPPPPPPTMTEAPKSNVRVSDIRIPAGTMAAGGRNLPVMGTAAGSLGKGAFRLEGGVIDYVLRPEVLRNVKDAYGIYVEGESMYPAHPHGELRIIHPHRPCQIGDTIVLVARYSEDGPTEAWIKKLVKRTGEKLIVEQFNPPALIEFDRRYVETCHKVLTLNDLLGI
ncbi:phage repressor protein C with HTH and peptisase S24 domain [Bosea sp. OAE506]|uniref:XRE family transcriptional regulator n=1 Tax=Bosea sp. OAE506 TaxID=2663870 RepID=UPI00178B25DC